ncbi:MAG: hypothetical protein CSA81_05635 [Acidobacteria bacterium]|nr:MAG: hypothetical protein CSA81_05635 [Acidobacteriota bacterium]
MTQDGLKRTDLTYKSSGGAGYIHRITSCEPGPPVLLVHGSFENGRIFYSGKGKGLAPFLAQRGFDTYSMDWPGKGKSTPPLKKGDLYGQTDFIKYDLPQCFEAVKEVSGRYPELLIGHSWGGVLLSSFLVRHPEYTRHVRALAYFGTKRTIKVQHLKKWLGVDLVWTLLGRLSCLIFGYFNATFMRIGVENDTAASYRQIASWVVKDSKWIDPVDQFDYAQAARNVTLPSALYLTGENDAYLGNPIDVQSFIDESGPHPHEYHVCGKSTGFSHNYDHVDILTRSSAVEEIFPMIVRWFSEGSS